MYPRDIEKWARGYFFCQTTGPKYLSKWYLFKGLNNSDLTAGLTSWQGALFLTDWILGKFGNNIDLNGSRIVELGAGVGFLGLHLLKSIPSIKSYNFTDGHRKCMRIIFLK